MAWNYSNTAVETTLSAPVNSSATSITVVSTSGFPVSFPFTLVLDYGSASKEVVNVTALAGSTLTITRGQDGTSAQGHSAGARVVHAVVARDLKEPQDHIAASGNVHGVGAPSNVVGTATTQTLTNKTMSGASNTFSAIPAASVTGPYTDLVAQSSGTAAVPLTAKGVSGQTADRFRAEDNLGASPTKINAAGQLVTESIQPTGTLAIGNSVSVTGSVTASTTITATGAATVGGTLTANGLLDANLGADISGGSGIVLNAGANNVTATAGTFGVTGTHAVTGNATVSGSLTVAGTNVITEINNRTPQFVRKTADESITSSTTLQNDDALLFAAAINTNYEFELDLFCVGSINGDIKTAFTFPTGAVLKWGGHGLSNAAASQAGELFAACALDVAEDTALQWGVHGSGTLLRLYGFLDMAGTAGNLTLRWAQGTSNATATTIKAGSRLRYWTVP